LLITIGSEDGAAQNVADGAVGGLPHLFEAEFLDSCLIGGDGRALDADMMLLNGVGGIDGHLIIGFVTVLDTQIVVVEVHVEVRQNQTILDVLPDHAGHLVAVEFDNGAFDLDFGHASS
jgi:hypothetical protein